MRAVDTNVLVRLITRDTPAQVASAEAFIAQGAWVSLLALTEAMWVLSAIYRRSPKEISTAVAMLLNHDQLSLQDPGAVSEALDLFQFRPALGFSDCLMLQIARQTGQLPLGTFDRGLSRVEGTHRL